MAKQTEITVQAPDDVVGVEDQDFIAYDYEALRKRFVTKTEPAPERKTKEGYSNTNLRDENVRYVVVHDMERATNPSGYFIVVLFVEGYGDKDTAYGTAYINAKNISDEFLYSAKLEVPKDRLKRDKVEAYKILIHNWDAFNKALEEEINTRVQSLRQLLDTSRKMRNETLRTTNRVQRKAIDGALASSQMPAAGVLRDSREKLHSTKVRASQLEEQARLKEMVNAALKGQELPPMKSMIRAEEQQGGVKPKKVKVPRKISIN